MQVGAYFSHENKSHFESIIFKKACVAKTTGCEGQFSHNGCLGQIADFCFSFIGNADVVLIDLENKTNKFKNWCQEPSVFI